MWIIPIYHFDFIVLKEYLTAQLELTTETDTLISIPDNRLLQEICQLLEQWIDKLRVSIYD